MSRAEPRQRRWRPTPDTAIALAALALAAGGGGYALGAAGSSPTITACIDPATNQPAAIVTTGACAGGQTPITWNQIGPQGPPGPAGKDASVEPTVISLPAVQKREARGKFRVRVLLPASGTYLLEGHVDWTRKALAADVPAACSITRAGPGGGTLDTLNPTIGRNGPFAGEIDENALTTVAKAPAGPGGVQQLPAPVSVFFGCTARTTITFRDWTFTATPVKVTSVPKPN